MLDLESNGAIFGPPFLPQHQLPQSGPSSCPASYYRAQ